MRIFKYKIYLLNLMLMVTFILSTNITAKAESDNVNLALNDTYVSGTITNTGEADFYNITLHSPGLLKVTYQGCGLGYSDAYVYKPDLSSYYGYAHIDSGSTLQNPKTASVSLWLEKGSYVIKVYASTFGSGTTGDYKIKATFTPAGNNESEPNDYYESAMELAQGRLVTGLISSNDPADFYRFSLSANTTVNIICTGRFAVDYKLYNSDFMDIGYKLTEGSESNPSTSTLTKELKAGTYYIKITTFGYYTIKTGRYQLKWDTVVANSNTQNKNSSLNNSSYSNAAKKYSEDNKVLSPTVSKVSSLKAKTKSGRKVKLSWKKQINARKYEIQISNDKKFNNNVKTKIVKASKHSLTIKAKHKGKNYIRVRGIDKDGKVGNWSSVKKIKVK